MVLQHPLEAILTDEKLPPNEWHALRMYQELEADQVACVLLARWAAAKLLRGCTSFAWGLQICSTLSCRRTGRDPWAILRKSLADAARFAAQCKPIVGAPVALAALRLTAEPLALGTVTASEQARRSFWPGDEKLAWNYAHILPRAQRIFETRARQGD